MWLFYQDVYPEGQRPPVLPAAMSSAPRKWPGRWKGLTKALLPEERVISEKQREMMYRSQCRAEPRAPTARLELFLCQDAKVQAQLALQQELYRSSYWHSASVLWAGQE